MEGRWLLKATKTMLLPAMQISNSSRPLIRIAHRLMRFGRQSEIVILLRYHDYICILLCLHAVIT